MAGKRNYGDRCGVARALDIVGERWALLVVRELLLGPKRFTDLRAGLPHVSADVLTQRLRELGEAGVVAHRRLDPPGAQQVYELTERGQALEPVVLALGRWGSTAPLADAGAAIGPDALAVALKTQFDPARAGALDATFELRLAGQPFRARVAGGAFDVVRGRAELPDAVLEAEPGALAEVIWHGRDLTTAVRAGDVAVTGRETRVRRFLTLFPLPPEPGTF
ncbi:MAG: helix-turn-helix domain-containing protein [Solirubrobacteraceae bacterium]